MAQHKAPPLTRCEECLSTGIHRVDCETGKRERSERAAEHAAKALSEPPRNKAMESPIRKR